MEDNSNLINKFGLKGERIPHDSWKKSDIYELKNMSVMDDIQTAKKKVDKNKEPDDRIDFSKKIEKKNLLPIYKYDDTVNYNIVVPMEVEYLMRSIKGYKVNLGLEKLDHVSRGDNRLLLNTKENFRVYLNNKGVEIMAIGIYKKFFVWQLLSGFDPKKIYLFNENKFVQDWSIEDKWDSFKKIEWILFPEKWNILDEPKESNIEKGSEDKSEPKKNLLDIYINTIKND